MQVCTEKNARILQSRVTGLGPREELFRCPATLFLLRLRLRDLCRLTLGRFAARVLALGRVADVTARSCGFNADDIARLRAPVEMRARITADGRGYATRGARDDEPTDRS